jgi:hypothetical protein
MFHQQSFIPLNPVDAATPVPVNSINFIKGA